MCDIIHNKSHRHQGEVRRTKPFDAVDRFYLEQNNCDSTLILLDYIVRKNWACPPSTSGSLYREACIWKPVFWHLHFWCMHLYVNDMRVKGLKDILQAMASQSWYIIAYGDLRFLIIDFAQNIWGCNYYIILLLCGNYASSHCSTLSTCCIRATVCSIRYFNWQKSHVFVRLINNLCTLYYSAYCLVLLLT